ncbi:MAG: hypothetical protein WCH34_04885 [Bacteroidota bacterium]
MDILSRLKIEDSEDWERHQKGEQIDTLTAQCRNNALSAVRFAKENFNLNLDFSTESIFTVEKIMDNLHSSLLRKRPSEDHVENISRLFAGYFGEVIRANYGGKWVRANDQPITNN